MPVVCRVMGLMLMVCGGKAEPWMRPSLGSRMIPHIQYTPPTLGVPPVLLRRLLSVLPAAAGVGAGIHPAVPRGAGGVVPGLQGVGGRQVARQAGRVGGQPGRVGGQSGRVGGQPGRPAAQGRPHATHGTLNPAHPATLSHHTTCLSTYTHYTCITCTHARTHAHTHTSPVVPLAASQRSLDAALAWSQVCWEEVDTVS